MTRIGITDAESFASCGISTLPDSGKTTRTRHLTVSFEPKSRALTPSSRSYIGSLYAKNPAVFVQPDLRARGNPEVAEATANQFLLTVRDQVEDATRLALIYPCAFVKLAPIESVDPLKRVSMAALPPWEVIVDATAASWDGQRYVGHAYLMPLEEAVVRFSKSEDQFRPRVYSKWIDSSEIAGKSQSMGLDTSASAPTTEKWIRVVESIRLVVRQAPCLVRRLFGRRRIPIRRRDGSSRSA